MELLTRTHRQLQPEERITLASYRQQGHSIRKAAHLMNRSPSTISRELKRNSNDTQCYASEHARSLCRARRIQSRPAPKLAVDSVLYGVVCDLLKEHWSPQQISLSLCKTYPHTKAYRVSTETIYSCIYAHPVGELKRELVSHLRRAHKTRTPRSKGVDRRGQIPEMVSIHLRPPEIEDRQFPGHWEGDLIKGEGNASAVGTLVERTSRLVMLVKLPQYKPASAANVLQAFTDKLNGIAKPMRLSMTYDQGREMSKHQQLSENTGIAVYFCDPHSPWQRGTNENTNGLIRQYLPKGTDLSVYSQVQLDAIADQMNNRPRLGLGVRTPLAV